MFACQFQNKGLKARNVLECTQQSSASTMQIWATYAPKYVLPHNDQDTSHVPNPTFSRLHLP